MGTGGLRMGLTAQIVPNQTLPVTVANRLQHVNKPQKAPIPEVIGQSLGVRCLVNTHVSWKYKASPHL